MNYPNDSFHDDVGSLEASHIQAFMTKVFSIMTMGLAITGGLAFITSVVPPLRQLALSAYWIFAIVEFIIVIYLSARATRMDSNTAYGWFLLYSGLNGLTLSPIFMIYMKTTIYSAFFITAGMFGAMAFWGATTKKDLTSLGSFCFMGLIGLILASIVNMFLGSQGFDLILSYAAVGIFIGLTAWDTQKLKLIAQSGQGSGSVAVLGALSLYLDFILLFQYILKILGGSRD